MAVITFILALILAWPTMGISLIVWVIYVAMNLKKDRQINELRDARRVPPAHDSGPNPEGIKANMRAVLEQFSSLTDQQASDTFDHLDVIPLGTDVSPSTTAGYFRRATQYGIENIEPLAAHMVKIGIVARQRTVTNATQEAGLRSILYWCIENGARANRDQFHLVDIAAASRKGAAADRKLLG